MEETTDVEMSSAPCINTKEVVDKWMEKFRQGELSNFHFQEYWETWVPEIYNIPENQDSLSWNFNEEEFQKVLISPLEEFICNGDPAPVLTTLSEIDKSSSVCGRLFKTGEATFSCRECGMDNTCVLCLDCFKQSVHRFHKYKMGTSEEGGCCDCGDKEAWKKTPFCDIHIVGLQERNEPKKSLPENLVERTRIVFEAVLWQAHDLLTLKKMSLLNSISDELFSVDKYCTVVFNDEVHTFDQVITVLTQVLHCTQRHAVDYATNIDREGRAVLNCFSLQQCHELKTEIKKCVRKNSNLPLRVIVVHANIVALQLFSLKLLEWLQVFLKHGKSFRRIFTQVVLTPLSELCLIEGIFLHNSKLWKSARTHWHRLFVAGMLLEYENKKEFGRVFTKNYAAIIREFIRDDHDHSLSICSLSVQLFTVPTLAHYLITHENVLVTLLGTFLAECAPLCNKKGRFAFEKIVSYEGLKRAQYILYDIRYLLSAVPEEWSDELRESFLRGFSELLKLLFMMEGMDSVTRQTGQHVRYEPEWESAFNQYIKLSPSVTLALKWCAADRVVLITIYKAVLKKLFENPCYDPNGTGEVREIAEHSVACIKYNVLAKPVSVHLTLTRFLAGLHLSLEKFGLCFDHPEFQIDKPTPVQLIEPVLRTQVMIAQVHAGMWRRNGYALINQLYFYHNVRCRAEMYDRDIQMLQIGASLIESNEFLIHLLSKFNLIEWASPDFETNVIGNLEEDSIKQMLTIIKEFLQLLIKIIGERYVPGIGQVSIRDQIKKEIIQYLCIRPLSHSELNRCISDNITNEIDVDDVIQELAVFKKPAQRTGKGVYELKGEYYSEYNVFFYHYTREELSKSEEAQRKRRKNVGLLDCCPPPKLPKLHESFSPLVNLLQCDVMLHIMKLTLEYSLNLKSKAVSESHLHRILHLIGYGLQEEQSGNYPFFSFCDKAEKLKLPEMLEKLMKSPRVESHKDFLLWIIMKFKEVRQGTPCASTSNLLETARNNEVDTEKRRRAEMAARKRAKLMAQMRVMQSSFMRENAKLFEKTHPDLSKTTDLKNLQMDITDKNDEMAIALGPNQTTRVNVEKVCTCILCQEEQKVDIEGPVLVMAAFVQQATVLCVNKTEEALDISTHDPLYLNSNLGPAPHTSTCGHVMHTTCWQKFFDSVMLKEHKRPYGLQHPSSFDVNKQEYLCPLCQRLSNTVLPLIPSLCSIQPSRPKNGLSFENYLRCLQITLSKMGKFVPNKCNENCTNVHCNGCSDAVPSTSECETNSISIPFLYELTNEELGGVTESFKALFPFDYPKLTDKLSEMLHLFLQIAYTIGLNVNPHPTDKRLAPMTWKSFSYTLHSIEMLLRDANKPLLGNLTSRQSDCLESFVRMLGVLGSSWPKFNFISNHAARLLSILLNHSNEDPSLLEWDSIGILVPLTFSMPALFCKNEPTPIPTGGTLELHNLHLIFVAHIVKIIITMNVDEITSFMDTDYNKKVKEVTEEEAGTSMETNYDSEDEEILEIFRFLNKNYKQISGQTLWEQIKECCKPFLRCCVLFYHYLTDVTPTSSLMEVGGDTFSNMCSYLGLPQTPREILGSEIVQNLIKKWCLHPKVVSYIQGKTRDVIREPQPINQLAHLPEDYSEVINTVSSFLCPTSNQEDCKNPALCLACGQIICSQSYCCQRELNKSTVGACNYHAYKCGAGIGMFLRARECEIILLAVPTRGCLRASPYLDEYGETDQGLQRGHPLRLCNENYKKLHTLWLSHNIHEEISRTIETSHSILLTQWLHI